MISFPSICTSCGGSHCLTLWRVEPPTPSPDYEAMANEEESSDENILPPTPSSEEGFEEVDWDDVARED